MQPYIPYIVLEALAAERTRDLERRGQERGLLPRLMLRQRLGAWLVRAGERLQPLAPAPEAA